MRENDDEVSIFDILIVLLKHKKMILIGTLICTIGFTFFTFWKTKNEVNYAVKVSIESYKLHYKLGIFGGSIFKKDDSFIYDMGQLYRDKAFGYVKNINYVESLVEKYPTVFNSTGREEKIFALKKNFGLENSEFASDNETILTEYVRYYILDKQLCISDSTWNGMDLTLYTNDKNNGRRLLEQIYADLNRYLNVSCNTNSVEYYIPLGPVEVEFLIDNSDIKNIKILNKKELVISLLKSFLISFVASFFVFCLIAFIINAIRNIKSDKELVQKLSDAWHEK